MSDLVRPLQPLWTYLHEQARTLYYWMTEQSEWATELIFRSADRLTTWYRRWLRHTIYTLQCKDVLRYLGKKVPQRGYGGFAGEAKIDLRIALYGQTSDPAERRRQSAAVTRRLALLRAHGLIVKVTRSHRYHLSASGRRIVTTLLAAQACDVGRLASTA